MNILHRKVSKTRCLLAISLTLNVVMGGGYCVYERQTRMLSLALERRGLLTVPDRATPDYWTRMGWANCIARLDTSFDVAFFGNSITRGSDFQRYFPDRRIINLGLSGDFLTGMRRRVAMLVAARPRKIFLMAGTNDLVHISTEGYTRRYAELLRAIRDSLPEAQLYVQSVLPSNPQMSHAAPNAKVRQANAAVRRLCATFGCRYIDLYTLYADDRDELPRALTRDGVHLFPQGYDRWARAIRAYVYE